MFRSRFTTSLLRQPALLIVFFGFIGLAANVEANQEYDKAILQTEQMAEDLQSYQLSGSITMTNQPRGETGAPELTATLVAAARWPDLLVNRQGGEMATIDLGTGPQQSWFYFGMMDAAYVGKPTTLNRDLANAGVRELSVEHVFNFYNGVSQFLLATDLTVEPESGQETLTVNGQDVACLVFRTKGTDVVAGEGKPVDGPQVIYYDPASNLVLKNVQTIYYAGGGAEIERVVTFKLSEFSLNEGVEEEQFSFTPPAQTNVVNQLERLTNPNSMIGESAPDITFTDFEGKTFNLSDLRGKPVFIDFWATWCGPCKMEMPHIESLYRELGKPGQIQIIAASSEDKHTVQSFLAKYSYSFQVVTVAGADAQRNFKTNSIPAGFVIDAEGVIRAHMVGAQTEAQLRAAFAKVGVQ